MINDFQVPVAEKERSTYIYSRSVIEATSIVCKPNKDAKYFRKHIWHFNSHFSFTTFGVSIDQRLANPKGSGVYCVCF
jgi:hypothetical protein